MEAHKGEEKDAIVRGAGYVSKRGDKESLQYSRFWEEYAVAQGMEFAHTAAQPKRNSTGLGKEGTYKLKVGTKGIVPVGAFYTRQVNMQPGSIITVVVEDGCLVLEPEGYSSEGYGKEETAAAPAASIPSILPAPPVASLSAIA